MRFVRSANVVFSVGLRHAGCYPDRLKTFLGLVDWVGLGIKVLPEDYPTLTGMPGSGARAFEKFGYIQESGVAAEAYIMVHAALLLSVRIEHLLNTLETPACGTSCCSVAETCECRTRHWGSIPRHSWRLIAAGWRSVQIKLDSTPDRPEDISGKNHWDGVYRDRAGDDLSWLRPMPRDQWR